MALLKNYKMSKGISKNIVSEGCEKKLLERLINFIPFTVVLFIFSPSLMLSEIRSFMF